MMHFYAQNAVPGLYEGRNGRLQKIFILHLQPKMGGGGGYKPGGYTRHYSTRNVKAVCGPLL